VIFGCSVSILTNLFFQMSCGLSKHLLRRWRLRQVVNYLDTDINQVCVNQNPHVWGGKWWARAFLEEPAHFASNPACGGWREVGARIFRGANMFFEHTILCSWRCLWQHSRTAGCCSNLQLQASLNSERVGQCARAMNRCRASTQDQTRR